MELKRFYTIDVSAADAVFDRYIAGVWVGSGGTVILKNDEGTSVTFTNVPSGYFLPFPTKTVVSSGTTASGLVAVFPEGLA